jgi:hypothetical protein
MNIATVQDAEAIREQIEEFAAEGWAADPESGRIDWEDWFDRFERYTGHDLPSQLDDPAILRVQKIARAAWREARGDG